MPRKALRSAATGDGASSAVLIRGLRKQYETGKVALHDLWLAIEKGECFGLLGG
jgi:ABC-type multidrug transport system ATPase subunit